MALVARPGRLLADPRGPPGQALELAKNIAPEKFVEIEGASLSFEPEALRAIATKAAAKGTGARGLRSVIEEVMLEIMYDIPSCKDIKEVVITKEMVEREAKAFSLPKPVSEALPKVTEERRESA